MVQTIPLMLYIVLWVTPGLIFGGILLRRDFCRRGYITVGDLVGMTVLCSTTGCIAGVIGVMFWLSELKFWDKPVFSCHAPSSKK